jgi:hypothetical protein
MKVVIWFLLAFLLYAVKAKPPRTVFRSWEQYYGAEKEGHEESILRNWDFSSPVHHGRQKQNNLVESWKSGRTTRRWWMDQALARQERLKSSNRHIESRTGRSKIISKLPMDDVQVIWKNRKRQLQQNGKNDTVNISDIEDVLSLAIQVCEDDAAYLELNKEKKYHCTCMKNTMNGATMNCKAQCGHYCNQNATAQTRPGDICGREEYDHIYDLNGQIIERADHFLYTKGITNQLSIIERDCSGRDSETIDGLSCDTCFVTVGTTQACQTCQMIACTNGGKAALIDCENIEKGSVFNLCERHSIPVHDSVFSKMSPGGFEQCTDDSPENDVCDKSELIIPGGNSILGMTNQAIVDDVIPCTGRSLSPGLWYSVKGTGSGLKVSTCGSVTDFDTQISVYTGSCDTLQCVASNDDTVNGECGLGQSVAGFFGDDGVVYHIKVHGFRSAMGIFELEIRETDLALDECTAMIARTTLPVPPEQGLECICQSMEDGSQSLYCSDNCIYCSDDGLTCSTKSTSGIFQQQSTVYSRKSFYTYTKGMNHTIEIYEFDCSADGCEGCNVSLDGVSCDSCSIKKCENPSHRETGFSVDCGNFATNAKFDACNESFSLNGSIFQALSPNSFQKCQQDPMEACNIVAELTMESSSSQKTTCSCIQNSDEIVSLLCHDDNCRFCNHEAEVCANITFGGTVSGQSPGFDVEYRQYEYITGRREVLRYEENDDGCTFFIDGDICNSCKRELCLGEMEEYQGISVDCSNIDPDAIFKECRDGHVGNMTTVFEVLSNSDFDQCIEGEDPEESCLRMKKYEESYGFERNTSCVCTSNPISEEHTLTCTDSGCLYCNHFATVCASNAYGYRIGSFGEPTSYFDGYYYRRDEGGMTDGEHVVVEQTNGECRVRVDGQECTSCELDLCAGQGQGRLFHDIRVDCENIEAGASFGSCGSVFVDTGILKVVSDDDYQKCIVPRSPEEACLAEASLRHGETDDYSCDCTPNDHGGFDLLCIEEGCLYCSADGELCGYDTSGAVFNRLGYPIETTSGFKFISGMDGILLFRQLSDPVDPRDCLVSFNDEVCSSCEINECSSSSHGLTVDCHNIPGGSVIQQCDFVEVDGFLEYLSPYSFQQCMNTMNPAFPESHTHPSLEEVVYSNQSGGRMVLVSIGLIVIQAMLQVVYCTSQQ